MNDFNLEFLFVTPIYKSSIDIEDNIISSLKKEETRRNMTKNGFSTRGNLQSKEEYKCLFDDIDKHVYKYCQEIYKLKVSYEYSCNGAWVNVHEPDDWAQVHAHPHSNISGILYLDVPEPIESAGVLNFLNPNFHPFTEFFNFEYEDFNIFNCQNVTFIPKSNEIYLFPSTLKHSVTKNLTEYNRYSLAFDYIISSPILTDENTLVMKKCE
jgi:uncharacterized protein (TIGR02466 family)